MANILKALAWLAPAALLIADGRFDRKLGKDQRVDHALNRLAFGSRPGEAERIRKSGLDRWIDQQLHPEGIAANPVLAERLAPLKTLDLSTAEIAEKYPLRAGAGAGAAAAAKGGTSRDKLERRRPIAVVGADLVSAKIYRAIYSDRQLEEVLADFWFNHFNVYMNKGPARLFLTSYERDAIRPHVLGKFGDLLLATARHPAMLYYLDNWQSVDPAALDGARKKRMPKRARGLNENYARELMELHTLGVDGGYSQKDVVEVARCFTGWTLIDPRGGASYTFAARLHDRKEKTVLGRAIAAGRGEEDGLEVLDLLAKHPSTARFISTKLARRFVADQPPPALVDRMAATFRKTGGDLREVMKTMIASPEFFSEGALRAKLKSPFEMAISAARALGAEVTDPLPLSARIDQLGQPLYRKEEPTGYFDTAEEWANTAGLLGRMNFATALASNQLPGARVDAERYASMGVKLGSPEFQRR